MWRIPFANNAEVWKCGEVQGLFAEGSTVSEFHQKINYIWWILRRHSVKNLVLITFVRIKKEQKNKWTFFYVQYSQIFEIALLLETFTDLSVCPSGKNDV
jgi:hypothetical protein